MCSVSRWKLREALLHGAEEIVESGKQFSSYELLGGESGEVKVHFADGDKIECNVLVGADGVGSKLRKLLLPNSQRSPSCLLQSAIYSRNRGHDSSCSYCAECAQLSVCAACQDTRSD
jgi:2-polyprenyl-6-methoxyphenol hydroxylase-like FAD-dependent oxidoreductase